MGTKDRTVSNYAIIGSAVKYIYDLHEELFKALGHPWEEMVYKFLPGSFKDGVRLSHPEISRPDLILKGYLRDVAKVLVSLSMTEVNEIGCPK